MAQLTEPFLKWAQGLGGEYGGHVGAVSGDSLSLEFSSDRSEKLSGGDEPILLKENPETPNDWRVRLQHVEKRIATALISAPISFSCAIKQTGKHRDANGEVDVVRFAFGLTLSLGAPCTLRYTAYHVKGIDRAFYIPGQDRLFELCAGGGRVNLRDKTLISGLRQILNVIPEAEREYAEVDVVRQQVDWLKKQLSGELRDLDRLYIASHGQYAQLLGKPSGSVKGDDAIELEYFNKLEDIVGKYRVSVRLAPLSLGLIRCKVKAKKAKGAGQITIPFVDRLFNL